MARLPINPVLGREVRVKMRTWRFFAMVSVYLLFLGGLGLMFFATQSYGLRSGFYDLATVGQGLFAYLAVLQFIFIYFIVPGTTANVISGERERQTMDLLVCTQLTPAGIVRGKLTAALSTVLLLIVATLPLYGFVFFLGGVAPGQLLKLIGIFFFTAFVYGSFALCFSAWFRRSISAVITSYGLALFMLGGTLLVSGMLMALFYNRNIQVPFFLLLHLNPMSMFEVIYPEIVSDIISSVSAGAYPYTWQWLKFWHVTALVNGLLAVGALYLAGRAVNPLAGKRRAG